MRTAFSAVLLGACAVAVAFVFVMTDAYDLMMKGEEVDGRVAYMFLYERGIDDDAQTRRMVRYVYSLPDSGQHYLYGSVSANEWDRLQVGQSVTIRYVPTTPDRSILASDWAWTQGTLMAAMAAGLLAVAFSLRNARSVVRVYREQRHMVHVDGIIRRVEISGRTARVEYSYAYEDETYEGLWLVRPRKGEVYAAGDALAIEVLPEQPGQGRVAGSRPMQ